jgi:hypothetical protein
MVKTGTGSITPRIATVAEVNSNLSNWESQLVTINGANITGNSGKFGNEWRYSDRRECWRIYYCLQGTEVHLVAVPIQLEQETLVGFCPFLMVPSN